MKFGRANWRTCFKSHLHVRHSKERPAVFWENSNLQRPQLKWMTLLLCVWNLLWMKFGRTIWRTCFKAIFTCAIARGNLPFFERIQTSRDQNWNGWHYYCVFEMHCEWNLGERFGELASKATFTCAIAKGNLPFLRGFKPPKTKIEMDDIIIVCLKFIVNEIWESKLENLLQKPPSRAP